MKRLLVLCFLFPLMNAHAIQVLDGSNLVVQEISIAEAGQLGFTPEVVRKTDSLGDQGIVLTRPNALNGSLFQHASIEIFGFEQSIAKFLMVNHDAAEILTADVNPDMIDYVEFVVFFEGGYVFKFGAEISAL